jgi:hypothetical protein
MSIFGRSNKTKHPKAEIVLSAIRAVVKMVRAIEDREGFSSAPDYHHELVEEADEKIMALKVQVERLSSGSAAVWKGEVLGYVNNAIKIKSLKEKQRFLANAANIVDEYLKKN